jgi:Spy/CpxP family protein refolding chaperone
MTTRLATLITVIALALAAVGTVAVAATTTAGQTTQSADKLDKPGKHCGDKNHIGNIDHGHDPDTTDCK